MHIMFQFIFSKWTLCLIIFITNYDSWKSLINFLSFLICHSFFRYLPLNKFVAPPKLYKLVKSQKFLMLYQNTLFARLKVYLKFFYLISSTDSIKSIDYSLCLRVCYVDGGSILALNNWSTLDVLPERTKYPH